MAVNIEISITRAQVGTGFTLSMHVDVYANISAEIFVYKRNLGTGDDEFSHVATPSELSTLSRYTPDAGQVYFLDHTISLELETAQIMLDTEALILADVRKLKADWELVYDQISTTYTVTI